MIEWIFLLNWPLITKIATKLDIDHKLLAAMVITESGGQPCAARYEPNYRWLKTPEVFASKLRITEETERRLQMTSFGLLQIMGATARDIGFGGHITELCNPETGLYWGAKYLKRLMNKYDDLDDVIASYNAGSPNKVGGLYRNQEYVDKINDRMREI